MNPRVLLIDDDISLRNALNKVLSYKGYSVTTAASYDEAITELDSNSFDVIITDIILGGKTGIDVLREVNERKLACPLIIITGAPSLETAAEAVRLGAYDYIPKPISKETLLRVTGMALNFKTVLDEKEQYRSNIEAIFSSVQDGIITIDRELNILEVNMAGEKMFGITRDAIGRELSEVAGGYGDKFMSAIMETIESRKPVEKNRIECSNNGLPLKVASINVSPLINPGGDFAGVVLVIKDETPLVSLEQQLIAYGKFDKMIGSSNKMHELYSLIETLADVDSTALILGESGTGKELVAEALHYKGRRSSKPFIKVNCSSLSENLLESELFGHVKGAFTGAVTGRTGRFEMADGGTIFLDEIGEISETLQVKLLRVLQEKEIERVGETVSRKVDVRIIAATNRDLKEKVKNGEFREDLYYRLHIALLTMPPLRERKEDIPLLIEHFISMFNIKFDKNIKSVSDDAVSKLMNYAWPGNVRELEHAIEVASIHCRNSIITMEYLPSDLDVDNTDDAPEPEVHDGPSAILNALKKVRWNKAKAARLLGISRQTLYNKIAEYNIE
jgi:PAS domain S-box-containing protein